MKKTFKQRFWKYGKWLGGLFFLMLAFRLTYSYVSTDTASGNDYSNDFFSSVDNLRKNYASEKGYKTMSSRHIPKENFQQVDFSASQKYEKTATMKSKSTQFEADVKEIKTTTKNFEGTIQYEQNTGNKGSREIHLLIGINPEKFDSFYAQIKGIGVIKSTEITKIDKTNEYRQLNAKKASLEKTLISLNELKSKGGVISDYISLHDKILEIESQMQELNVETKTFQAESYFAQAKALEEAANRTQFAAKKKKKAQREALELYRKALELGKNEAQVKVEELEKDLG